MVGCMVWLQAGLYWAALCRGQLEATVTMSALRQSSPASFQGGEIYHKVLSQLGSRGVGSCVVLASNWGTAAQRPIGMIGEVVLLCHLCMENASCGCGQPARCPHWHAGLRKLAMSWPAGCSWFFSGS